MKFYILRPIFLGLFLSVGILFAHPWKPGSYVVVDTDAGVDDLRTLLLLLKSKDVCVLAITVSNGVVPAEIGYQKVKNLVEAIHQQGILVGINRTPVSASSFEPAAAYRWTDKNDSNYREVPFVSVLDKIKEYSNEKITFINLASLHTISFYLKENPLFAMRIKQTIWTVDSSLIESYNYKLSPTAYDEFCHFKIPLIKIESKPNLIYPMNLMHNNERVIRENEQIFYESLSQGTLMFSNVICDELAFLYLLQPTLFNEREETFFNLASHQVPFCPSFLYHYISEENIPTHQVLKYFPTDTMLYIHDVSPHIKNVIDKFGFEEWTHCVLTNELHRHIGIYAIIGAKMGMRARDYFGVGADELRVVSDAGFDPPLSCLNDGLQASTGATVGHGLLQIADLPTHLPGAQFEYLGQRIKISLKESYQGELHSEIEQLVQIYSLNSDVYWDIIRQIALRCWFEWDRNTIFQITVLEKN